VVVLTAMDLDERELAELAGDVEAVIRKAEMTPARVLDHIRHALHEGQA
jgi:hypothetical protein